MFCRNWWWRGQDNITGSSRSEWLFGNWRDNTIDGAGGNDVIFSRWGNDVVSGGDGNDWIWSGHGNDTVNGDAGRDFVFGGSGRDVVDGGAGSDKVYGGRGDDEAIYTVSENQGAKDYYNGGSGNDLLVLRMTHAEYEAAKSELDAFDQYLAERACGWKYKAFHFQSFDLTVRDFERFEVELTDEPPADPNVAPEAVADSVASTVDGLAIQDAEANDPDGQPADLAFEPLGPLPRLSQILRQDLALLSGARCALRSNVDNGSGSWLRRNLDRAESNRARLAERRAAEADGG